MNKIDDTGKVEGVYNFHTHQFAEDPHVSLKAEYILRKLYL